MDVRRHLLEQVAVARDAGRHEEALELLDRAGQIAMNSSVRRAQAQELDALGRFAEALGRSSECLSEAQREPASPARNEVLTDCQTLTRSLEPRVGRVVVHVPANPPTGLVVRIDGHEVEAALWGAGYPVTPGTVIVEASAPSMAPLRREIVVGARGVIDVSVDLHSASDSSSTVAPGSTHETAPAGQNGASGSGNEAGGSIVPGAVVVGVGVVGIVTSVVLYALMGSEIGSLNSQCSTASGTRVCDDTPALRATDSRARGYEIGADVALGVGLAAAVAGVALVAMSGHHEARPAARMRWNVSPVAGGVMFGIGGTL